LDGEKMNKKQLWIVVALVAIAVVMVPVAACEGVVGSPQVVI